MRYTVILERDPSGILVAHVPALRGCVSQGRNRREAVRNIKEAVVVQRKMESGVARTSERPSCSDA
jgi:hypothetical protein